MARGPLLGLVLLQWIAMALIGLIWFNQAVTKQGGGYEAPHKDSAAAHETPAGLEQLLSRGNGSLHEAIAQRHRGKAGNTGPCNPRELLRPKALIGMIHVQALPGTPYNRMSVAEIVDIARREAASLQAWGVDAIMIENMHDRPYLPSEKIGPESVSGMTAVGIAVR